MKKFDYVAFMEEFLELTDELFQGETPPHLYSPEQWDNERGEKYGRGALLTAVIEESSWYNILNGNYQYPEDCEAVEDALERLQELEEKFGVWHELGYAWSIHWYPE
jgi:hypothetical protein